MKTLYILIATCAVCLGTLSGCKQKEGKSTRPITPPKYEGKVDYSVAPTHIDLESALNGEKQPLKLSQIASEIDYYIVGDGNFTVKQAISIPDSNAFITFNNPRLYYRKIGSAAQHE